MIDFHTHIIPGFDDGAQNTKMSLEMLNDSFEHGVDTVISTSHFYPKGNDSLNKFLERRSDRLIHLKHEIVRTNTNVPQIIKAAEVSISVDFSDYKMLKNLCIENTDYMLVEMPYGKWEDWVFDTIYSLVVKGYKPIIAHIERYKNIKSEFNSLFELKPLYQINADLFLTYGGRIRAAELIRSGHAHVIGSDMHNTTSRAPNLAEAYRIINQKFGAEYADFFNENAKKIINNESVDKNGARKLKKVSRLSLIF